MIEIKQAIVNLGVLFDHLCDLIEKEHAALEAGDLDLIETITREKSNLSNELDACFETLKVRMTQSGSNAQTLGEYIAHISKDEVSDLPEIYAEVLEKSSGYKNAVDVNRKVLSKLLANRQQNYQFWQDLLAETVAPYDESGKKRVSSRSSSLQVRT